MKNFREHYLYYALIVVLSLISLVFLPMIGLDQDGEVNFNFPKSTMGWVVWGVSKGCVCLINCLLFHFFVRQGHDNIRDDEVYIDCCKREGKLKLEDYTPKHPKRLEGEAYLSKGGTVLLSTALTLLALPSAILQWSLMSFLSTLFSVAMAISFGFMQMRTTEQRWTVDYEKYINYYEAQIQGRTVENNNNANLIDDGTIACSGGDNGANSNT